MSYQATQNSARTGGCYCGAVRYELTARPVVKGQCHCRACQHIAGGAPQYFMLIPEPGFEWTDQPAATYRRPDLDTAVTRYFCQTCGTHIVTRRPDGDEWVLKVGTLDDPTGFAPRVAICHAQAPGFHMVPDGIPVFDDIPPRG